MKAFDLDPALLERLSTCAAGASDLGLPWLPLLDQLLATAARPVRLLQWRLGAETSFLLSQPGLGQLVVLEPDLSRIEKARKEFATHLRLGKLQLHPFPGTASGAATSLDWARPTAEPFDLALIPNDPQRARWTDLSRQWVAQDGLIVWTDICSWAEEANDPYLEDAEVRERFYLDLRQCLLIANRRSANPVPASAALAARESFLKEVFRRLDEADIEFVLLGNPGNLPAIYGQKTPIPELLKQRADQRSPINPESIPDIDVLVATQDFQPAVSCVTECGLQPETAAALEPALYSGGRTQFFFSQEHVVRLHLFGGLQYASLDRQHRVGLHRSLEAEVLARRRRTPELWRYATAVNDSLVHNLCRCVFDKSSVPEIYGRFIHLLYQAADRQALRAGLESVFFKFADRAEGLLAENRAAEFARAYLTFQEY